MALSFTLCVANPSGANPVYAVLVIAYSKHLPQLKSHKLYAILSGALGTNNDTTPKINDASTDFRLPHCKLNIKIRVNQIIISQPN